MTDSSTAILEKWCGPVVEIDAMAAGKAREFAAFLASRDDVGATILEAREGNDRSWVVVEFELDVGQQPEVAIERRERVALGFPANDRNWPSALVIRDDFPANLPHTFLVAEGEPSLLCLSEEPWAETKRRWSPYMLVRTVRHWFNETAKGTLHQGDQALEPFVVGSAYQAVLPANYEELCAASPSRLYGYGIEGSPIVRFSGSPRDGVQAVFTATHFVLPPQTHGFIRHSAKNVADLIRLFTVGGFDFKAALVGVIRDWLNNKTLRLKNPVIVVSIPTRRTPTGPVERTDVRMFLLDATVRDLGFALDLWAAVPNDKGGMDEGPTIGPQNADFDGAVVSVMLLSTLTEITHESAAHYNGYEHASGKRIVVVGAGALGSQVVGNLVRMGETIAGVADSDVLLPHNLARHDCFNSRAVGLFKSLVVASDANNMFSTPPETAAFRVDVLVPGDDTDAFNAAVMDADVILDLAASVAVSRCLGIDNPATGRRAAAFLSPNGYDVVVLVEDAARNVQLDELEMAYYASIVGDPALDGHLRTAGHVRYGQSCRDLSSQIEQAHVAIGAGIAAKALREAIAGDSPVAKVWRTDPQTLEVRATEIDPRPMKRFEGGGWTILVRPGLLDAIRTSRHEHLPNETGGVLLGDFDTSRKRIYLVDALATPPDSKEEKGSFVRGSYGLPEALADAEEKTQQMLRYVGEWHSHPDGYGVRPSGDDVGLYSFMARQMAVEGYPPIMLIAGDGEYSLIVEEQRIPLDRPEEG